MGKIEFETLVIPYTENKSIESNCIDITFVNKGASTANINTYPLAPGTATIPGESLSISANIGEIDRSKYSLVFSGAGANLVYVIRRVYKNPA